jgi:hypothetical protein
MRFLALLLVLSACTPQPSPVVPTPDASDASAFGETAPPAPPAPPPASSVCMAACAAEQAAGCVVLSDCGSVLQARTQARLARNAKTGNALTCDDLAAVKTAADVKALGQPCGP